MATTWLRYWLGWGLIGAGYVFGEYPIRVGGKHPALWLGATLAILGALIIGSFAMGRGYFQNFRTLALDPQEPVRLSLMLATALGPALIVVGLVVIALDITGPDFIEAVSTWHYALPLIAGVVLTLLAPIMKMYETGRANKTGRASCQQGADEQRRQT